MPTQEPSYGQQIRAMRKKHGLTQEELAKRAQISVMSLRRYESNERQPNLRVIDNLAAALALDRGEFLFGNTEIDLSQNDFKSPFWISYLTDKLKQIGCDVGYYEDDAVLWITYPDGTLEIREEDLKDLHRKSNDYMRFLLSELKRTNISSFRKKGVF